MKTQGPRCPIDAPKKTDEEVIAGILKRLMKIEIELHQLRKEKKWTTKT